MTFGDGATSKFVNCDFDVHAGSKVKESGAKQKRPKATLPNDINERAKGGEVQEASTSRHHLDGIVFVGRGNQTEAEAESRLKSSEQSDYVNRMKTFLQQTFNQKDVKIQIVGPEGDSVKLEGCRVEIHPTAVSEAKEIEVSLDINPDHFPDSVSLVPISHILKCKPSVFEHPVRVRLKSFLIPKSGKELRFTILSRTGEGEWKPILEGTVAKSVIEYEVQHFCSHVAVVSIEDEENGEYHLFNDVWMHIETGRVLSIFCKDEFSLKKVTKVLEVEHERILPLPEEVFVSIGNTIKVEIKCNSPLGMRMASIDESNGRLKISHELSRMSFFAMFFQPEPHPDNFRPTEPYELYYHASIVDARGHAVEGGFLELLDYSWPVLQSKEPNSGESSQDDPQPSDESGSILTKENSTETLQQAADSLPIEKKIESSGTVQSTKITDSDQGCSPSVDKQSGGYVVIPMSEGKEDNDGSIEEDEPLQEEPSPGPNEADFDLFDNEVDKAILVKIAPDVLHHALGSPDYLREMLPGPGGIHNSTSSHDLLLFIRQNHLLNEIIIHDIQIDNSHNQKEFRRELTKKVVVSQGMNLTPRKLLKMSREYEIRHIYDELCKAFMKHLVDSRTAASALRKVH